MVDTAVVLFFIFMLIYLFICEIFTILFRITGINESVARFQVISMLAGCGYTTNESELITKDRRRRELAFITILFGYVFTATIISMVVNLINNFINKGNVISLILQGSLAIIFITLIWLSLLKVPYVHAFFDKLISTIGMRLMYNHKRNPIRILEVFDDEVLAEVSLTAIPPSLIGIMIRDIHLDETYHITLLKVQRSDEESAQSLLSSTVEVGDELIIFGKLDNIKHLFVQRIV